MALIDGFFRWLFTDAFWPIVFPICFYLALSALGNGKPAHKAQRWHDGWKM